MPRSDTSSSTPEFTPGVPHYLLAPKDFSTTWNIRVQHWVANLIILPVYVASIALIMQGIDNRTWWGTALAILVLILAAIPILLDVGAPTYWRGANRSRFRIVATAVMVALTWLLLNPGPEVFEWWMVSTVAYAIVSLLWVFLYISRNNISVLLRFMPIFTLIAAAIILVSQVENLPATWHDFLNMASSYWFNVGFVILVLIGVTYFIRYFIYFVRERVHKLRSLSPLDWLRQNLSLVAHLLTLTLVALALFVYPGRSDTSAYQILLGCLGLFALYVAAPFWQLISEQRASYMYLRRHQRRNRIMSRISRYIEPQHTLTQLRDVWIPRYLSLENRSMMFVLCLVVGGIAVPLVFHLLVNLHPDKQLDDFLDRIFGNDFWFLSPLQLMLIGIVTTVILLLVYSAWYLIYHRDRYIVTQFSSQASDPDDNREIQQIAESARQMLIDELQAVGTLLRQRQIENVHLIRDDVNAFFMTSGFESELFDQIQQIVTVEIGTTGGSASGAFDLGRFAKFVAQTLARIRINGVVQRQANGDIVIFVEMRYRNRVSRMIQAPITTPIAGGHIDTTLIQATVRQVALKLLISLGQVPGVGDSWKVLDCFLQGLAASSQHNWWLAISNYYRALQVDEEARSQRLGVVYYHLGSTLAYQGRWQEGFQMLRNAEAYGPPMAVTHYMLAFTTLYTFWGDLHNSDTVFDEIVYRCKRALRMRANFPEAHQLLGITYYRRSRVLDRQGDIPPAQRSKRDFAQDYGVATRAFRRALRGYDKKLRQSNNQIAFMGLENTEVKILARQRNIVGHQLGDSLRGNYRYAEADQYYEDMLDSQRTNVRNIADMLKTYCLGGTWQRAQQFLYEVAFRHEPARWDADVLIHAGWLIAGGALSENADKCNKLALKAFQYIDYAIYARPRTAHPWRQTQWERTFRDLVARLEGADVQIRDTFYIQNDEIPKKYGNVVWVAIEWRKHIYTLIEGVEEPESTTPSQSQDDTDRIQMRLANLAQARRHLESKAHALAKVFEETQINQRRNPQEALYTLHKTLSKVKEQNESIFGVSPHLLIFKKNLEAYLHDIKALEEQVASIEDKEEKETYTNVENEVKSLRVMIATTLKPLNNLKELDYLHEYTELVTEIIEQESQSLQRERFGDAVTDLKQVDTALKTYKLWKKMNERFWFCELNMADTDQQLENNCDYVDNLVKIDTLTPEGRIALDLYIQIAMLAARILAEAQRFDPLVQVAEKTCERLEKHRNAWAEKFRFGQRTPGEETHFTYSPLVYRYQYATLRGWYAYALLMRDDNPVSRNISDVLGEEFTETKPGEQSLEKAWREIQAAHKEIPIHPLVMFVRAKLMQRNQLYPQAIQELRSLLDVIDPLDPKSDIGMSTGETRPPRATTSTRRELRYHMERVIGRQQFHNIINPVTIYELMADYAGHIEESANAVTYLSDAVRRSPFNDLDFHLFEKLGTQLNSLERYNDALAIADAMKTPREMLTSQSLLGIHGLAPEILELEVLTRKGAYNDAREHARRLARKFRIQIEVGTNESPFNDEFAKLTRQFTRYYTKHYSPPDRPNPTIVRLKEILDDDKVMNGLGDSASFAAGLKWLIKYISDRHDLPLDGTENIHFSDMFKMINDVTCKPFSISKLRIKGDHSAEFVPPTDGSQDEKGNLYYAFNHLAERSRYLLDHEKLKEVLTNRYKRYDKNNNESGEDQLPDFKLSKFTRVLIHQARQARSTLIYLAQLLNALAYNRARLNLASPNFGFLDAAIAIYIYTYLYQTCDPREPMRHEIARKLAQACDTYAWTEYTHIKSISDISADPKDMEIRLKNLRIDYERVEHFLRQGLRYDPARAIIRYHLAQIYYDIADLLLINSVGESKSSINHPMAKEYIEKGESELEIARERDHSGRLSDQLDRLRSRYTALKENLEDLNETDIIVVKP